MFGRSTSSARQISSWPRGISKARASIPFHHYCPFCRSGRDVVAERDGRAAHGAPPHRAGVRVWGPWAARVAETMWRATASNGAPGQNAPCGACGVYSATVYAGDVSGLPFGTTMNTSARAGASAFADPPDV